MNFKCESISKSFDRNVIFRNVTLDLTGGDSLAIIGRNGSGKSTLMKVLSGLLKPDTGKITLEDSKNSSNEIFTKLGLIAPYINLYDELTGEENLRFFYSLKSSFLKENKTEVLISERIASLLNMTGLYEKRNEAVKNYSSGMKQRLKISFALLNDPEILLMDEPGTNLDESGKKVVKQIAEGQTARGILLIATNDPSDKDLCSGFLNIEDFSQKFTGQNKN